MNVLPPPSPLELTGNVADNWKRFKQRFQLYLDATGASKKDEKQQTSLLLHIIGTDALEVYNTFKWDDAGDTEGDSMRLCKVMAKIEKYCTPKTNLTLERFHFNSCIQQPGEGVDAFLTGLKKHSKTCDFGALQDSLVKDRLVCGIIDNTTRERLLREEDLTLEKAVKVCKAAELVKERSRELQASSSVIHTVNKNGSARPKTQRVSTKAQAQATGRAYQQSTARGTTSQANKGHGELSQRVKEKHHCRRCDNWHVSGKCPAYGGNM